MVWGLEFQCFREGNRVLKFKAFRVFGFKGGGALCLGALGVRV